MELTLLLAETLKINVNINCCNYVGELIRDSLLPTLSGKR
jgi:hypothetical protein